MFLTISIANAGAKVDGRKTIGSEGIQIGRAKENGWVIEDPYISRVHARIRCIDSAYYIEGVGRNPLAVSQPSNFVSNHDPQLLKVNDRFFLDQYEFIVEAAPSPVSRQEQRALATLDIKDALVANSGSLDPLAALGVPPVVPAAPSSASAENPANHVINGHFQAPRALPVELATARIPEAWNRSGLTHIEAHPISLLSKANSTADSTRTDVYQEPAQAHAGSALTTQSPVLPVAAVHQADTHDLDEARSSKVRSLAHEQMTVFPPENQTEVADAQPDLNELLQIVTKGVMEVLQSRTQIKSQLRMSMTRIQPMENNPLKFSPNVQAALKAMLVERNGSYLPMTRAFEEAFADIRHHQIAVLQGMRAAFEAMLEQFDPAKLKAELDSLERYGGRLSKLGAGSRFKDFYDRRFAQLSQDRDNSFRRLFQDYFTRAYEEQMAAFKTSAAVSDRQKDV